MSTKCQYQAASSNPIEWVLEMLWDVMRRRDTSRKVVPIITWSPWNPVAMKNVDPYDESAIENSA